MTFQTGTTLASETSLDLLAKIVQVATSRHVTAATPDAVGSGYVAGDVLTYDTGDAATVFPATFEVLTVTTGQPTALRVITGGAFANRASAATINTTTTTGSGYAASSTVIVRVKGGTATQQCKLEVSTDGSGVPTGTPTVLEGGGAYSVNPGTDLETEVIGPNGATGSGLRVDLTMVSLPGSFNNLSLTGGTGTGAQADLTMGTELWSCNEDTVVSGSLTKGRDRHNFLDAHPTTPKDDNKEVVLTGTVSGGNEPIIGFRSYTDGQGATDYTGINMWSLDTHNPALDISAQAPTDMKVGIASAEGSFIPLFDSAQPFWVWVNGRRIIIVAKTVNGAATVTAYMSGYVGLLAPFGTTTENPYPIFITGSTASSEKKPDDGAPDILGITECNRVTGRNGPAFYRQPDGTYELVYNGTGTVMGSLGSFDQRTLFPGGRPRIETSGEDFINDDGMFTFHGNVFPFDGGPPGIIVRPTKGSGDDRSPLIRVTVNLSRDGTPTEDVGAWGELENVYWLPKRAPGGGNLSPEDTVPQGSGASKRVFRVFPNGARDEEYSYFALEEI